MASARGNHGEEYHNHESATGGDRFSEPGMSQLHERIALHAYEHFDERSRQDGFDLEDLLMAERKLLEIRDVLTNQRL
jgi:predicted deacetylase